MTVRPSLVRGSAAAALPAAAAVVSCDSIVER
jgi:hypothetical protein